MATTRIDTQALLERVDLRLVVSQDLGRPRSTGKAAMYQCPFHDEHKGASLAVWRDGWQCFGRCGVGGSAIDWVMRRHGVGFLEACRMLSGDVLPQGKGYRAVHSQPCAAPPDPDWQAEAWQLIEDAQARLWSAEGAPAMTWLQRERRLRPETILAAQLGYLPGHWRQWHKFEHFTIPSGILIPWIVGETAWAIKVRLSGGEHKYMQASGGSIAGGLYWADNVLIVNPLLVCEGEFDCLIAWQEGQSYVSPITLGSKSATLDSRWYPLLWSARKIYTCFDNDAAGHEGAARFAQIAPQAVQVQVPDGKDINEFHIHRRDGVAAWLKAMTGSDQHEL